MARNDFVIDQEYIRDNLNKSGLDKSYELFKSIYDRLSEIVGKLDEMCSAHLDDDFNSINVGAKVTEPGQLNINSLQIIHIALYKAQKISAVARLKYYPKVIELVNDANTLYNSVINSVMNCDDFSEIKTSAEKNRVCDFICERFNNTYKDIKALDLKADSYISYIKDQIFHLNSLDNMIRTVDKMEASEIFTESKDTLNMTDNVVFTESGVAGIADLEEDDFDKKPKHNVVKTHTKSDAKNTTNSIEKKSKKPEPIDASDDDDIF